MDSSSIFKIFLILFVLWLIVQFWYVFVGIALIAALVLIAKRYFLLLEVSTLKTADVIFLPKQHAYAIAIDVFQQEREIVRPTEQRTYKHRRQEWMVKSIRPELNGDQVEFVESIDPIEDVAIVAEEANSNNLDLEIARQVSLPVKEIYSLKPKLMEFDQKVEELRRKERLANSSEVYTEKAQLFARASVQVEELISAGDKLRVDCLKFIRETLIGAELAKFDPETLPDPLEWKLKFQTTGEAFSERLQMLRDEINAFSELSKKLPD